MKSIAIMKHNGDSLQEPYLRGLKLYLKDSADTRLKSARALGRRAVKLGLETLDLAMIHETALLAHIENVSTSDERLYVINKARTFYAAAIIALEETHRAAREANARLHRLNVTLDQRTRELDAANRKLTKEVARRLLIEEDLRQREQQATQLLKQSQALQAQLRHLSHRIMSAQEDEKKRISRELHDRIAEMLSGISLRLATLKTELTANAKGLEKEIQGTQRLVEKSVDIVHRFARELRPAVLDDLGLIAALHSFVNTYSKQTGIRVHMTVFAGVTHLGNNACTVLYRVAQEALSNVTRHARASRVDINIQKHDNSVRMLITDDGRSFDVQKYLRARKPKGLGILSMRERVEMVGGTFAVESAPGHGTTIRADIPFDQQRKEHVRP